MVKFKRVDSKNGRTLYFRDGKMLSPKKIPQEILNELAFPGEVEVPEEDSEKETRESTEATGQTTERICLFCGQYGNFSKFLNGVTVYLCEDDYRVHTTGEISAEMRNQK